MHEPHDPKVCPACSSQRVVFGSLAAYDDSGTIKGGSFYPSGLKPFAMERSVRLMAGSKLFACLDCHLVWSTVIPGHLELLIKSHGADSLLQRLHTAAQSDV
jgi:hypothetical protein